MKFKIGDKVFLKNGIGAGQLYKIERVNYKLPKTECLITGLTGIYKHASKIVKFTNLHQPKVGYEWCFNQPSKTLNISRLVKELVGGEEWQQRKYIENLKKFAPIVYKRFKETKICDECKGFGGETRNIFCAYSDVLDLEGNHVMPTYFKCKKCKEKGIILPIAQCKERSRR